MAFYPIIGGDMGTFLIILGLSLIIIILSFISFYSAMGLSLNYWSEKQYNILRAICVSIGIIFFISIVLVGVISKDSFSDNNIKIMIILVVSEFLTVTIYSQIVHFIAWKKKVKILKNNIMKSICEKLNVVEESKLLNQCIKENRFNYTEKEVKKVFKKLLNNKL